MRARVQFAFICLCFDVLPKTSHEISFEVPQQRLPDAFRPPFAFLWSFQHLFFGNVDSAERWFVVTLQSAFK